MDGGSSKTSSKFSRELLCWYRRHRRPLPWRETNDPYRIWVSEIMLQQTRASAVVPYYERFLTRFPDVDSLARSEERDLLECWSGLGYYSRARNLRRAAREIVFERGRRFPETIDAWASLPGIGPYTAAAIASIAFGEPVVVLDGNVARVMARLANHRGDIGSKPIRDELRNLAQSSLDRRHPGEFNQALMELGATICVPRNPQCLLCPIAGFCEARKLGVQHELPVKLGRQAAVDLQIVVAVVEHDGMLLLRRRPEGLSLMPGFWELPQAEGPSFGPPLELGPPLGTFRHSITFHRYTITVFRGTLGGRRPAGFEWIDRERLKQLPLTTIARKALRAASIISTPKT